MTARILLASRAVGPFAICVTVLAGVAAGLSRHAFVIWLAKRHDAALMTLPELAAVLVACLGVILLRPRMWIIDRMGVPTRRWLPSAIALGLGICGPQLVLVAALAARLGPSSWSRSAANLLFLTALAFVVSPFIGALAASGLTLLLYLTLVISAQLEPAVAAWSPVAVSSQPSGRWLIAAAATVAVLVTTRTMGRTLRTWGRDLDTA